MNDLLVAPSIARGPDDERPWDVFASCDRYYWNRSGEQRRQSVRAKFTSPARAAIAVCVDTPEPVSLRTCIQNLEEAFGPPQAATLGWTSLGSRSYVLLDVPDPLPAAAVRRILGIPRVLNIEPDREGTATLYRIGGADSTSFDPVSCKPIRPRRLANHHDERLENQQPLTAVGIQPGSGRHGVKPITVAILDNGLQWDHPYVEPHLWENPGECGRGDCGDHDGNGLPNDAIGWNFYCNSPDPSPYNYEEHGTQMAGLVVAVANRAGIPVNVMPIRTDGPASRLSLRELARAIDYASQQHANIVVVAKCWSLVNASPDLGSVTQSIDRARQSLVVCAAGNHDEDIVERKIELARLGLTKPNVVTVAGADDGFCPSNYSSRYGEQLVRAPCGLGIESIGTQSLMYGAFSGTSAATAIVGGAAAVIANVTGVTDPADLKARLLQSCIPQNASGDAARMLDLRCLEASRR